MKYRFFTLLGLLVWVLAAVGQPKAKYVFYFIGDGMGVNQVNAAETYMGALEGRIGIKELCFPCFPFCALVNTQSATAGVTDSAAAGTALSTGHKTKNGALGVLKDGQTPVSSVAEWAHHAGAAVGIATTVNIDHATPSAFYAHVESRGETYKIGQQLVNSPNDFYAGSDFASPNNPEEGGPDLYQQASQAGFTLVRSYKEYQKKAKKADRMILFQSEEASKRDRGSVPYAIDQKPGDLNLVDITRAAVNFLTKKQDTKQGFFLMVEGGKIDYATHANDLCFIHEVINMDDAVRVAYEFYQQHPDETLIVVAADHETGGLTLGRGGYKLKLDVASYMRMSTNKLGSELHKLHDKYGDKYNWDLVRAYIAENFGFWDKVKLSDDQTKRIETSFNNIIEGKGKDVKSLYQKDNELAATVRQIINECAQVGWSTGGHSNGYVPCFAIGAGAELFTGRLDNTEISKRIARATGWEMK